MDWSGCDLVEIVPTQPGISIVKGTHIGADEVVAKFTGGVPLKQLAEFYPALPFETIRDLVSYGVERLAWDTKTLVDWTGCTFVEQVPGRCSGAPTVVGTRISPDTVAKYYWSGATVEKIRDEYPTLQESIILGLIKHLESRQASAA